KRPQIHALTIRPKQYQGIADFCNIYHAGHRLVRNAIRNTCPGRIKFGSLPITSTLLLYISRQREPSPKVFLAIAQSVSPGLTVYVSIGNAGLTLVSVRFRASTKRMVYQQSP